MSVQFATETKADQHPFISADLPPVQEGGIALRFFDIAPKLRLQMDTEAVTNPEAVRQFKIRLLNQLGIEVSEGQNTLTAWVLAMARENSLPEVTPQHQIGAAAAELCPQWVWALA